LTKTTEVVNNKPEKISKETIVA